MESIDDLQTIQEVRVGNHQFQVEELEGILIHTSEDPSLYCVWIDGQSIAIRISNTDPLKRRYTLTIDQSQYAISLWRKIDLRVISMGYKESVNLHRESVLAPMPGLIKSISVKVGSTVEPGQPLLVLEAMKMENIIKANHRGIVQTILVVPGQIVEKAQQLIMYKD